MNLHVHPAAARRAEEERRLDEALETGVREAAAELKAAHRRRRRLGLAALLVGVAFAGGVAGWVLRDRTRTPEQLVREGWQLWRDGRSDEAQPLFEKAVRRSPTLTEGWNGLGWTRLAQGDDQGSRAAFDTVLALRPEHGAALNGLGQLAWRRCDVAAAEAAWMRAARQAPAAQMSLVRLYLLEGRWDDAQRWAAHLRTFDADSAAFAEAARTAARERRIRPELAGRFGTRPCPGDPGGRS